MTSLHTAASPFDLMINPEAVFAAIERSGRLSRLQSRICRPLDKQLPIPADNEEAALEAQVEDAAEIGPDLIC